MVKVTKAVIAAAGFGTRFLPQTKAMPKEMLPLIDKPIIQYVVEELVEAGIKDIIIVGSSNKRSIEDHFDLPSEDLLNNLRAGGEKKKHYIDEIEHIADMANFIYIRQKGPYGNATPLMNAGPIIGSEEPFIYTFADDFIVSSPNRFKQMIQAHNELGGSVLSCKRIRDDDEYDRYGVVAGNSMRDGLIELTHIAEKPGKAQAPSNLASVSSYLFSGDIFRYINEAFEEFDGSGEFVQQPVLQRMIDDDYKFYGLEIENGKYYDTGDRLEYLKTVVDFALAHDELGKPFGQYIKSLGL